jgi:hypothetical protein
MAHGGGFVIEQPGGVVREQLASAQQRQQLRLVLDKRHAKVRSYRRPAGEPSRALAHPLRHRLRPRLRFVDVDHVVPAVGHLPHRIDARGVRLRYKYPSFPIAALLAGDAFDQFTAAMDWVIDEGSQATP